MKVVSDIISGRELYCVTVGMAVVDVIRFMAEKNVGAVVVVDDLQTKRLRGVFSERDLMKRVMLAGLDAAKTKIDDVMTKNVAVGHKNESYDVCLERMKRIRSRHLPIVDGERLLGMVSMRDLLEVDLEDKTEEIKMMNAYIHDVPKSML